MYRKRTCGGVHVKIRGRAEQSMLVQQGHRQTNEFSDGTLMTLMHITGALATNEGTTTLDTFCYGHRALER
jgi:hypothetical protein